MSGTCNKRLQSKNFAKVIGTLNYYLLLLDINLQCNLNCKRFLLFLKLLVNIISRTEQIKGRLTDKDTYQERGLLEYCNRQTSLVPFRSVKTKYNSKNCKSLLVIQKGIRLQDKKKNRKSLVQIILFHTLIGTKILNNN